MLQSQLHEWRKFLYMLQTVTLSVQQEKLLEVTVNTTLASFHLDVRVPLTPTVNHPFGKVHDIFWKCHVVFVEFKKVLLNVNNIIFCRLPQQYRVWQSFSNPRPNSLTLFACEHLHCNFIPVTTILTLDINLMYSHNMDRHYDLALHSSTSQQMT